MSGICGIVDLDGDPVDRDLLQEMTAYLSFRGPDAQNIWIDRGIGFGHSLLRSTFESEHEAQPFSLDGRVWITADARIDGQEELRQKIASKRCLSPNNIPECVTDAELILHAYFAWGDECLKHLLGDFAFAIWDGRRKRLLCARDHFGVKPFFYARVGQSLVFSNSLDCVRKHPKVSARLNELSIADFLLFEMNQDPTATAFADVQRLSPAQTLTWSADGLILDKYWSLPADMDVRYRSAGDYVENFSHLLEKAVSDRLRTNRVCVEMSGGLDSTAVAATAKQLLNRQAHAFDLSAYTVVYDRLLPDEERKFAGMAAEALEIPIAFVAGDDYGLYQDCNAAGMRFPEPMHQPDGAAGCDAFRAHAARCRVLLTGWDGDALLSESPKPYFRQLLKNGSILRAVLGSLQYAISERRLLPLGFSARLRNAVGGRQPAGDPFYPAWLNPAFEQRLSLRDRWEQVNAAPEVSHALRPYAFRSFAFIARCSNFFDGYDAGVTGLPIECRHPLLDLRLLDFCLTIPSFPWCVKKNLLRTAMCGVLPEAVRLRPKTPMAGWPGARMLESAESQWIDSFHATPVLGEYVVRNKVPTIRGSDQSDEAWSNLRPLSLNLWLQKRELGTRQSKGAIREYN